MTVCRFFEKKLFSHFETAITCCKYIQRLKIVQVVEIKSRVRRDNLVKFLIIFSRFVHANSTMPRRLNWLFRRVEDRIIPTRNVVGRRFSGFLILTCVSGRD